MRTRGFYMVCCCLLLVGCVEPYAPDAIKNPNRYLVVDGFLNGNGVTTVKLSRTQNIAEDTLATDETGATIFIEDEQGAQEALAEVETGIYKTSVQLDPARRYRLAIRTAEGKVYASEYVEVKQTPPIDEVPWNIAGREVIISVDTHDPQNSTRYYRWECESTWEYTSAYNAFLKYDTALDSIVGMGKDEFSLYHCWQTEPSTDIRIATSVLLSQDVVSRYVLQTVPAESERLRIRYSLLVKQYALTKEAYQYWEALKKNTESIGTLFDPLPTQLTGNVHCLSVPDEPVMGYVGASTVQEKRIFIDRDELPEAWVIEYPTCPVDSILLADVPLYFEQSDQYLPYTQLYTTTSPFALLGYTIARRHCLDCTELGGTNVEPDFWK